MLKIILDEKKQTYFPFILEHIRKRDMLLENERQISIRSEKNVYSDTPLEFILKSDFPHILKNKEADIAQQKACILCPYHKEKTASMKVTTTFAICYGCGHRPSPLEFKKDIQYLIRKGIRRFSDQNL
ncbi:MAG: CHC2 zinc finger domain-containing protein [Candidatus Woesearchaeota archaeon]